jgi:hypothetical protein
VHKHAARHDFTRLRELLRYRIAVEYIGHGRSTGLRIYNTATIETARREDRKYACYKTTGTRDSAHQRISACEKRHFV